MRPLPVNFIQDLDNSAQGTTPSNISIINLTWVTFFSLFRPDEYYKVSIDTANHPFRLKDVQLFIGKHPYNAATNTSDILAHAKFCSIFFTMQKNGVKGKLIGNG